MSERCVHCGLPLKWGEADLGPQPEENRKRLRSCAGLVTSCPSRQIGHGLVCPEHGFQLEWAGEGEG